MRKVESSESEDDGNSPELTEDIYLLKHSIPVFLTSEFFILITDDPKEGLLLAYLTHDEGIVKKGKYSLENLFMLVEEIIEWHFSDD